MSEDVCLEVFSDTYWDLQNILYQHLSLAVNETFLFGLHLFLLLKTYWVNTYHFGSVYFYVIDNISELTSWTL